MSIFNEFKGFWGTGAELTERAKLLSKALGIKSEKLTERLVRYYATEGVLDKPDRLGREAAYHFRHLVQLLIARRLVNEGVTLVAISSFNLNNSTEELEQALLKPSKEEASKVSEQYLENRLELKMSRPTNDGMDNPDKSIKEVTQINENIYKLLAELESNKFQIRDMLKRMEENQQELRKRIEYEREDIRRLIMTSIEKMMETLVRGNLDFREEINLLQYQMESRHKEFINIINEQQEQRIVLK